MRQSTAKALKFKSQRLPTTKRGTLWWLRHWDSSRLPAAGRNNIDCRGRKGFACYWKEPDLTDSSVEANVLASFAGFCAEKRLRSMRGFQPREYLGVIWSTDWKEARALEAKFSNAYLGDKSIPAVHEELEAKADEIVAQYWPAIEKVAKILLARNWEQKKAFESGTEWSESANAKYITGEELVTVFVGLGIAAQVMAAR